MGALHTFERSDPNTKQSRSISYYEWGDTTNPNVVVCVHGLSRNARDFDYLAQALSSNARVLSVDMAGRGKSDWLTDKAGYNYLTYVADMIALLNHLGLNKVTWIGTSMGGIIALMFAAQQPGRIERLVLNDVGKIVSSVGLKRILNYVGSRSEFANKEEAMTYLRKALATFGINSEAHWQFMFEISFNAHADGRYTIAYDPAISQPFKEAASKGTEIIDVDLTALWNAVTCPALIIRGGESDILTHEVAVSMCERPLPTKLVELPGVGHAPALLDDEQISIIIDWLKN